MATDDETEDTDDIDTIVERKVAERLQRERDGAAKAKKLKEMGLTGEVLEAIADAVWDRGEARADARRKADDDKDQPPSTGKPRKPGFLQSIGLAPADEDAG